MAPPEPGRLARRRSAWLLRRRTSQESETAATGVGQQPAPRGVDGPHGSRDPLRVNHEHRRRRADFPAVGGTPDGEPSVPLMELRPVLTEAPPRGVWAMSGRRSATGSALLRKAEVRKEVLRSNFVSHGQLR